MCNVFKLRKYSTGSNLLCWVNWRKEIPIIWVVAPRLHFKLLVETQTSGLPG